MVTVFLLLGDDFLVSAMRSGSLMTGVLKGEGRVLDFLVVDEGRVVVVVSDKL